MSDTTVQNSAGERLYNLLPALYRSRDFSQGEPLRALLAIIESELGAIENDVAGLYENWFIETCQEWAVPYIGDLLGVRNLKPIADAAFTARSFVAHTLRYRRQKGTAAMLEQLARDVTNWPARVVESFTFIDTMQYLNHLRPQNLVTADLRDTNVLELLGSPFEGTNHTVEIRSAANEGGKYNVPNLSVYLWRLASYPLTRTTARPDTDGADGRYRFNVRGLDAPLFNQNPALSDGTRVTAEHQVPGTLRRRALYDDLEALRQAIVDGQPRNSIYFGSDPVAAISVGGISIPPQQIAISDLSDQPLPPGSWPQPPATLQYTPAVGGADVNLPVKVSIDPLLGRLAFAAGSIPAASTPVLVSYSQGFSGDLGGGPYSRANSLPASAPAGKRLWHVAVTKEPVPKDFPLLVFSTLADAISTASTGWNAQPPGTFGALTILDSGTYQENLTVTIPDRSQLLVLAAGVQVENGSVIALEPINLRPHLRGNVQVTGTAPASSDTPGSLILNGLLIEGNVTALEGNLGSLQLAHCTLIPGAGGLQVFGNAGLETILNRTICAPISLGAAERLTVTDSIIDAGADIAIAAGAADTNIQSSTIIGAVGSLSTSGVRTLLAGNSIFTGPIFAERRQAGCVRFCVLDRDSRTPRRYRCQPDAALKDVDDPQAQEAIRIRLIPQFVSVTYGQPGYAQLASSCASEIRRGAEDGSEMGAFDFIKQPQREDNLQTSLNEYLRFGLEAGVFLVS